MPRVALKAIVPQVRSDAGGAHLLGHLPPAGAALERERYLAGAVEPGQPGGQMLPVRGCDPAAFPPAGVRIDVVER